MTTSAIGLGDSVGTNAVRDIAATSPIDRLPMFDCVYAYEYQCAEKVEKAGTKCSKCRVRTTEPSIVDIQSDL